MSAEAPKQPCAGGIVFDDRLRLLLIRRGKAPSAGAWSLPGGRCEPGERPDAACVREVAEETGLRVAVVRWVGRVERAAPAPAGDNAGGAGIYVIDDYLCRPVAGLADAAGRAVRAADDAVDVRWATRADLAELPMAPGVVDALTAWRMLPA